MEQEFVYLKELNQFYILGIISSWSQKENLPLLVVHPPERKKNTENVEENLTDSVSDDISEAQLIDNLEK